MRVVCLIQARLTSTRLPGKVLRKIGDYEVLWHVYQRCRAVLPAVAIIVPYGTANEPLMAWCAERDIPYVAGPEDDVLTRYVLAAAACGARDSDAIVRVTADCPFLSVSLLEQQLTHFADHPTYAYMIGNGAPEGAGAECIRAEALFRVATYPNLTRVDREHVTQYWRRNHNAIAPLDGHHPENWDTWRWTLDTPEDYAWFQEIATHVTTEPPHPTTEELCALFAERPDLIRRNPV